MNETWMNNFKNLIAYNGELYVVGADFAERQRPIGRLTIQKGTETTRNADATLQFTKC